MGNSLNLLCCIKTALHWALLIFHSRNQQSTPFNAEEIQTSYFCIRLRVGGQFKFYPQVYGDFSRTIWSLGTDQDSAADRKERKCVIGSAFLSGKASICISED